MMLPASVSLTVCLLAVSAPAPADLKSGPQVGEGVPGGFSTLFVNGVHAGKKCCPVWVDGYDLVALIFAREVSDPLTSLVKQIDRQLDDRAAGRRSRDRHGVFVIFCNDDAGMNRKLQALAVAEKLKQVVLCTNPAAGPKRYKVAKEADVTVVVYDSSENVTANFPLKKGELNEDKSRAILRAVTQVLPKK